MRENTILRSNQNGQEILMKDKTRLEQIRESERKSHIEMYSSEKLFSEGSWLRKPIKTIQNLIPIFRNYCELNVLDLGCGIGRNCIAIAEQYQDIICTIDCVDLLPLAIEKLMQNARDYGVEQNIRGILIPIEEYAIRENHYDLIIAVSALEHIDSVESFKNKLAEISRGIRENGIVCLVINSEVTEMRKETGEEVPAQFEVNLPTEDMQNLLQGIFADWAVIKSTVQEQQYDIPRDWGISDLKTKVVSFVARKERQCL